jgi:mono/diheme cytochrome c family protein
MGKTRLTLALLVLVSLAPALVWAADGAANSAQVAKGQGVYETYCVNCHGPELQNNTGVAFDLRRLRAGEHQRFVHSVLNGKNAMPAWKGILSNDDLNSLWAYIRANAYP